MYSILVYDQIPLVQIAFVRTPIFLIPISLQPAGVNTVTIIWLHIFNRLKNINSLQLHFAKNTDVWRMQTAPFIYFVDWSAPGWFDRGKFNFITIAVLAAILLVK